MTGIKTRARLVRARANQEKSIATVDPKKEPERRVVITYTRGKLKLDTLREIIPLARQKPETIGAAVDYMEYVRSKPRGESVVVRWARPRRIVSAPADSVETLVVKSVSMPLKSYSSSSLTRLATSVLGGFDVLMSQSLSVFLGLIVNVATAYLSYRKVGGSRSFLIRLVGLLALEGVMTLAVCALVALFDSVRHVAYAALICTAFFFLLNYAVKLISRYHDLQTALSIDAEVDRKIRERVLEKLAEREKIHNGSEPGLS